MPAKSPYSFSRPIHLDADLTGPGDKPAADARADGQPRSVEILEPGRVMPSEPLSAVAMRVLDFLPPNMTLTFTARRYPHVMNKLAILWDDARALEKYLDQLLMADRPNRQGFEYEALMELADVRDVRLRLLRNAEWMRRP